MNISILSITMTVYSGARRLPNNFFKKFSKNFGKNSDMIVI